MFVAFAAPSLAGKTQMAFTVDSKKPLYFPLEQGQSIYENFSYLSEGLMEMSRADLSEKIIKKNKTTTSTDIRIQYHKSKFRSLGLICALMEEGENFFDSSINIDWMAFFANRSEESRKTLLFAPMSLDQFRQHPKRDIFIKKYYIFLDEFSAQRENVFLRNLARSASLTCAVASTNTQVANLVGISHKSGTRTEGNKAWAVVVPQFPSICLEFSNLLKEEIVSDFLEHVRTVSPNEFDKMSFLFKQLLPDQFKNLRPGVSLLLVNIIKDIVDTLRNQMEPFTVKEVLEILLKRLALNLESRKTRAFQDYTGMAATLGLFSAHGFKHEYSLRDSIEASANFVDSHFYYLISPKTADSSKHKDGVFLLFSSQDFIKPYIHVGPQTKTREFVEFKPYAFFKEEEFLLALAFMFAPLPLSTSGIIHSTAVSSMTPNYKELAASGSILEIESMSAIIDSSHRSRTEPFGTFSGVLGDEFVAQVVDNLNIDLHSDRATRPTTTIKYSVPIIEQQLKAFKVPFLYASDMKWPALFQQMFPLNEGSGHIGNYERMSREDKIDGSFDILTLQDGSGDIWKPSTAIIEAKNYADGISPNDFFQIINKANQSEHKGYLHLCITSRAPGFIKTVGLKNFLNLNDSENDSETNTEEPKIHFSNNNINYYRLARERSDASEYTIRPINEIMTIHPNPDMICIIIETDVINKRPKRIKSSKREKSKSS